MRRVALTEAMLLRARLPKRYWDADIKNVPDEFDHSSTVKTYVDKIRDVVPDGIGLLLFGPNNHGKSYIAASILKEAKSCGFSVLWIRAYEASDMFIDREMYDLDTSIQDAMSSVDLLVIDDLGKEHETRSGFEKGLFENLIRARSDNERSTIITSNVTPKELRIGYKPSMIEVLKASVVPVMVQGKDFREIEKEKIRAKIGGASSR